MKPQILLVGGGGHCRSVIDVIELEDKFSIAGIVDKQELIGTKVFNYEVIGCDEDLETLHKTYKYAIVTVGQIKSNSLRIKLYTLLKNIGFI
jgi:FlaA1/EpsC-like NDP-sugar epimerase